MLDQWKFLLQGELVSNHQSPVNDQCWGSERLLKSHDRIHPPQFTSSHEFNLQFTIYSACFIIIFY